MAVKIDRNMQAFGKSNVPGFTRGSSFKHSEPKEKSKSKISSSDHLKELTKMIETMEFNHASQMSAMQNSLIAMDRSQNNRFQNNPNKNWKRKNHSQDQRPPNPKEYSNMV